MVVLHSADFEAVDESQPLQSRPILGLELLRLQGMRLADLPKLDGLLNFTHNEFASLAGNALCSSQFALAFLITMQVLGHLPDGDMLNTLRGINEKKRIFDVFKLALPVPLHNRLPQAKAKAKASANAKVVKRQNAEVMVEVVPAFQLSLHVCHCMCGYNGCVGCLTSIYFCKLQF